MQIPYKSFCTMSTEKFAVHSTKNFVNLGGMNSYAERLKYAIDRANTSQAEVARQVGVKQQSIQYLCSSRATGSKHTSKIAKILGVRPQWLAAGEGAMEEVIPPLEARAVIEEIERRTLTHELGENELELILNLVKRISSPPRSGG